MYFCLLGNLMSRQKKRIFKKVSPWTGERKHYKWQCKQKEKKPSVIASLESGTGQKLKESRTSMSYYDLWAARLPTYSHSDSPVCFNSSIFSAEKWILATKIRCETISSKIIWIAEPPTLGTKSSIQSHNATNFSP